MASVFQKFGGIRPMANAIEADFPPSTVKSWHKKRLIPKWRHRAILAAARMRGIDLTEDELLNVRQDDGDLDIHGRPRPAVDPGGVAA